MPKDHRFEIRRYMRDPDGYIIEVGQQKRFMMYTICIGHRNPND
jgi:hypothetical protein